MTTGELTREVAAILRGKAARLRIDQTALASAAGVSQSQVSKMLRGVATINVDQLDAMCYLLELEVADVLHEADHNTDARPRVAAVAQGESVSQSDRQTDRQTAPSQRNRRRQPPESPVARPAREGDAAATRPAVVFVGEGSQAVSDERADEAIRAIDRDLRVRHRRRGG